ncbi:MAG: type II secretion system secretin GspD [Candidatus Dadabacteria bacterium]|nr:type II secretion system secretin GspD [Candidatus Dadabacteria bacterium]NIV42244.1 type II secretion system secretin GspD [Candidatus Dadabacteria bacterium]NIX15336.1 type II secretion system secretin GspD [Candidatus Dadabacteria bacterium]
MNKELVAILILLTTLVTTNLFAQHSIDGNKAVKSVSYNYSKEIITHTVGKGDSMGGLAYRYKTTVDYIKKLNNITRDQVFLGEVLKVPFNTKNAKGKDAFISYTIQKGDSLSQIASKYKTDTKSIKIVNKLGRNQINVGQKLLIPYNKKFDSSKSYDSNKSIKTASKIDKKPAAIPVKGSKKKDYQKEIEDKYLSFLDKQEKLKEEEKSKVKTASLTKKSVKVASKSNINSPKDNKNYTDLEKSLKSDLEKSPGNKKVKKAKITKPVNKKSTKQGAYIDYVVKSGDSISILAQKHNTTAKTIRTLNNLERNQIDIGQTLKIPNIPPSKYKTYRIESGDSLSYLADRHGITTKELMKINGLSSKQINIGQKIKLPLTLEDVKEKPEIAVKEVKVAKTETIDKKIEKNIEKTEIKPQKTTGGGPFQIASNKEEIILGVNTAKVKQQTTEKVENKTDLSNEKIAKLDKLPNNKGKLDNSKNNDKPVLAKAQTSKTVNVIKPDSKIEKEVKKPETKQVIQAKKETASKQKAHIESVKTENTITKVDKEEKQAEIKPVIQTKKEDVIKKLVKKETEKETVKPETTTRTKKEVIKVAKSDSNINKSVKVDIPKTGKSNIITYTVESGDSVSVLADKYNTTSADIRKLNNLKDNNIKIGQKLKIAKMPPSPYLRYKVQSGDSLSVLAEKHGLTTKQAMEFNNLDSKQINIGQILKFPKEIDSNNEIKTTLVAMADSSKEVTNDEKSSKPVKEVAAKKEIFKEKKEEINQEVKKVKQNEVDKTEEKIEDIKIVKKQEPESQIIKKDEKTELIVKEDKNEPIKVEKVEKPENEASIQDKLEAVNENKKDVNDATAKKEDIKEENKVEEQPQVNNPEIINTAAEIKPVDTSSNVVKEQVVPEEPKTEKLVFREDKQENYVDDDVTLAQLLTIENSNIPEAEKRYENLLDDQIMLAANNHEQRYDRFAQNTPETKPTVPVVRRAPEVEATVNIPDEIDLRDFVRTISEITGESYILDDKLKSQKVTIVTPEGGFNKKNAIRLFGAILRIHGFTIYKKGILNVITESRDIKQKDIEVIEGRLVADPTDSFVTQIIPLKNISAQDVANTLKPLVSREGDIVVHAPLNTLIIVETESNLERLINILNNIDKEKDIIFVKIYNSEASDIAAMLTEIFGGQSASPISTTDEDRGDRRRRSTSRRARAARAAAGGQTEIAGFKIITDERTNSLIVIAYPDDMPKIKAAIERLDVEVDEPEHGIYVIRLKNGDAEQIVNVLNSLISGTANTSTRTSRGFAATRENQQRSQQDQGRGVQRTSATGAIAEFSLEDIRITSDISTNSIIVVGSRREFDAIKRVIDELDIRRRQVFVEAAILEVSLDQLKSLGTNLSIGFTINDDNLGFGGTNLPGVPSLLGAAADSENTVSLVGSLSGMFLGVVGEEVDPDGSGPIPPIPSFSALFQALTSVTDVNILSTPSIVTTDNEEAEIVVADVIPFPTGSTVGDSGVTVQTIDRQPVGIRLAITPQIGDGDFLHLELQTEVSSVRDAPTDLNTEDFGIATTTRTASSSVVVKNGQTIVIGGLVQDRESKLENRVPGLGSVPVLGNLFKFKSKSSSKINLMILLTPRIIEDERDMKLILEDRQKRNMLLQQRGFDTEGVY